MADGSHHSFEARGVVVMLVSAAAFGTSGPLAKSLLEVGWSPGAAVTARITVAAVLLLGPALGLVRRDRALVRRHLPMVASYGLLAVAGCQLFYFNAVRSLSVGVALLLEYLGLILVVGWLWVRHGQRPRRWTVVGVALAVAGLVLVLDVVGGAEVDATGVLWGLAAAVGLAGHFVLAAREAEGLPPLVMAAGGMVVGALALGLAGLLGLMAMEAPRVDADLAGAEVPWFVPVLLLGVLAGAFAYATGIAAARRLGSKVSAFLGLTEVLFAVLFSWWLLDELPLAVQLVGGVLILAGVAAVRYEEQSTQAPPLPQLPEPAPAPVRSDLQDPAPAP